MDELNCKTVRGSLWDFIAGSLEAGLSECIALHLNVCRECEMYRGEVRSVRSGLKHLPSRQVPDLLNMKLLVLASREHSRWRTRRNLSAWLGEQKSRAKLFFDNLLRPFAVPAAGGILASFLCFGVIVNTLHVSADWQDDIPIGFFTEIAINELSPFCSSGKDVMVQLSVDSRGRVTDFALPQNSNASPEEMQEIGNLVFYSTFTPATRLGQPVSSKRLFYIGHISIKG